MESVDAPADWVNMHVSDDLNDIEDDKERETAFSKTLRWLILFVCSILAIIPLFWPFYIRVADQYQRFVTFRLGKLSRPARGPGIIFFIPFVDSWEIVDLRVVTLNVPSQAMMTSDSVSCTVNGVVFLRVRDAIKAVITVDDYNRAVALLSQTVLRSVVGESELDELLSARTKINYRMKEILEAATLPLGVEVVSVEVKDVVLPTNMQRVMGAQAEADRERRAKIISANGEVQAADALLKAANTMTKNRATLLLRYLHTLDVISTEKNSTILFPIPMDIMGHMSGYLNPASTCAAGGTMETKEADPVAEEEAAGKRDHPVDAGVSKHPDGSDSGPSMPVEAPAIDVEHAVMM